MIKILHVVDVLQNNSGITNFLMNYYSNMNNPNIEFDFMCIKGDKDIIDNILLRGNKVYFMPNPKEKIMIRLKNYLNIFFKVHSKEYKIIHSHFNQVDKLLFSIASKYGKYMCISHSHSIKFSDCFWKSLRNKFMCSGLKKYATHYFACSDEAGRHLFGKKIGEEANFKIIKDAIDCKKYSFSPKNREEMRKKNNLNSKFVVGHIGSFQKGKNHKYLLKIFFEIHKRNKKAILLLIGSGPQIDAIRKQVNNYGLNEAVLFLGRRNDIDKWLCAMDVFVFPSNHEGFGIAPLEAQNCGLPTFISSRVPNMVNVYGCKSLSLKYPPKIWAEDILMLQEKIVYREDAYKYIAKAGFQITDAVEKLFKIYESELLKLGI